MKKTVPSQYSTKLPTAGKRPHIGNDPLLIRHSASAERDQCGRAIYARDVKAARNDVERNWRTAPAPEIKDSGALRKQAQKALDKGFIDPTRSGTICVPRQCVPFVMGYNSAC